MTTPTLAEQIDELERLMEKAKAENWGMSSPLSSYLLRHAGEILASLQRLAAIDAVKVLDEPSEVTANRMCGNNVESLQYIDTLLDLLRRETMAKEKAEAERDALQDRLNSTESLYVATIEREPLP